jgi:predicted HicB family RNase H-like nuclease
MSQITIRNLDPMVEELIRDIAEEEDKSLNQVCSDLIEKALKC